MEIKYKDLKQEEKNLFNLIDSLIIKNGVMKSIVSKK